MTFSIDNPEGGLQQPPLGKYVWEKPSGEQGLNPKIIELDTINTRVLVFPWVSTKLRPSLKFPLYRFSNKNTRVLS